MGETLWRRFHTVKGFEEEVCVLQGWGPPGAAEAPGEGEASEARASGSSQPNAADAGETPGR